MENYTEKMGTFAETQVTKYIDHITMIKVLTDKIIEQMPNAGDLNYLTIRELNKLCNTLSLAQIAAALTSIADERLGPHGHVRGVCETLIVIADEIKAMTEERKEE